MDSSLLNKLPDIWRLVAIECLDDRRTQFSMLLVSRTMFQTVVPVLYSNLPKIIEPFRNAQRLEWLLGFSAGLYTADKLPMTAAKEDHSWLPFTNSLTADYYSFVKTVDENWLLAPFLRTWTQVPEDEPDDVRDTRLEKLARESEAWTDWVACHAGKLKRLTLTPYFGWRPELNMTTMNNIVHQFKILEYVRIMPDPYTTPGQTSRWVTDVAGGQTYCQHLVHFVKAHRARFPGLLARSGIEITIEETSSVASQLWTQLLCDNIDSKNQPKTLKIDFRGRSDLATKGSQISVEAVESLTMLSFTLAQSRGMENVLHRCGPQLKSLDVEHNSDDWLAWARTTPEEEERARVRKEWQVTSEMYRLWNRIEASELNTELPIVFIPPSARHTPQHRPLFPNLTTLIIRGFRLIPVMDAIWIFRNSLQTVKIESMTPLDHTGKEFFGWTWQLPKLVSLNVDSLNLHFSSFSPTLCPNLRSLSLRSHRFKNIADVAMARDALKSLKLLENLSLSDRFEQEKGSSRTPEDEDEYDQDPWSVTVADGFEFPYLRNVTCQGRWAVWIQGAFLAIAPQLEKLALNTSANGFPKILNVSSFYGSSGNTDSIVTRPRLRWIELKHWTIEANQLGLFEHIFMPSESSPNVLCPRLWKVDLQYINGIEPNRLVQGLMRHRPEMRRVRLHKSGELDLTRDDFCRRWDPSVIPRQPVPQTAKERWASPGYSLQLRGETPLIVKDAGPERTNDIDEMAKIQQLSFSGVHASVGQCVLNYNGFLYVLYSNA